MSVGRYMASVYFIMSGDYAIKIGHAMDPLRRMEMLQIGNPDELTMLLILDGGTRLESQLHARFADARIRGEWFRPVPELVKYIWTKKNLRHG